MSGFGLSEFRKTVSWLECSRCWALGPAVSSCVVAILWIGSPVTLGKCIMVLFFAVPGLESGASGMLGRSSTTEVHPSPG